MKASRFADAQKAFVLKQGEEGTSVAELCRKAGALLHKWAQGIHCMNSA